jgi:thiamine biosynthesis lipoprotein
MGAISADAPVEFRTETWPALGTTAVLRYGGPGRPEIRAAVEREIDAIDAAASRFRSDSELSRLNAAAGAAVEVSRLLLDAVRLAVRAAQVTDGAVDPTLGECLVAAGYDRDWHELVAVPADAPLRSGDRLAVHGRRKAVWERIELGDDPPTIRLPRGVAVDLGATAKALAADRAADAARRAGAHGVLVSLGGDLGTTGRPPEGGWLIHVTDDHRAGPSATGQTISIQSGGVATSSIVARRWLRDGEAMHHILDPRSGEPVRTPWRTVSVAAATCADANIASTAAIVLGDDAPGWLAQQGLPARLVGLDGTVTIQGGWPS